VDRHRLFAEPDVTNNMDRALRGFSAIAFRFLFCSLDIIFTLKMAGD